MSLEKISSTENRETTSFDLSYYNQLLARIQEDPSSFGAFKDEQRKILGVFLRLQKEHQILQNLLRAESDSNALQIEELIRRLRIRLQESPMKLEPGNMSTTFLNVIETNDQLIERGYIRMDDVNPVPVPFVYHWAPNEVVPAIKNQGILPPFALGTDSGLYGFASLQRNNNYWHATLLHTRARAERDLRILKMETDELLEEAQKHYTLLKIQVTPETTFYTWPMEMIRFDHQAPLEPSMLSSVWGGDLISSKLVSLEKVMGFYVEHDEELKRTEKRKKRMSDAYTELRKRFSESESLRMLSKRYPSTYFLGGDDDSLLWKRVACQ